MRVLLLTQYFPPEPTQLYGELAVGLRDLGHDVVVVTGYPNWPSGRIYKGYKNKLYQWDEFQGVRVLRLKTFADHSQSRLKRIFNLCSLAMSFAVLGPWLLKRPQVIHVVQLATLAAAARWVGFLWRVPYTLEVQDLWPETLDSTGMVGSKKALAMVAKLCDKTYRWAKAIRVISPGFRENLIGKGVPEAKIRVIANWVDSEFYKPVPPDPELARKLGTVGKFNVLYAGNLGLAQNLETLVRAGALLKDLPDVQILFAGDGADKERLVALARELSVDNVRFLGSFPTAEMSGVYALADVLAVHLRDDPLFRITIPHKVQSYLAVGKSIVCAALGNPGDVVTDAGAGIVCPPENPEAFAQAVRALYDTPVADREAMGASGRAAAIAHFGKVSQITQISEMLEGVCPQRG